MNPGPKKISPQNALDRLMKICSQSEKSVFDVRQKLHEWGIEEDADKIISRLITDQFIDDGRFARAFVRDKIKFNKWGRIKVKFLLKGKQISQLIIDEALSSVSEEEYSEIVIGELEKKLKSLKNMNSFQTKSKLYAFGQQRGYEQELLFSFFGNHGLA
jgi:regulatory protein